MYIIINDLIEKKTVTSMTLKFYSSVAKELKLKVRQLYGLIPTFGVVTGVKPVGKGGTFS